MDLLSLARNLAKTPLLTLPRSDLLQDSTAISNNNDDDDHNDEENSAPKSIITAMNSQLVLMQLPKGVQIADLSSGGCYFTAAPRPTSSSNNDNNNDNLRQACLVMESSHKSYTVSRLETSNCLILVPPCTINNNDDSEVGPAAKKTKVDGHSPTSNALPLVSVPARLLQKGGSGASFLELREKRLGLGDVAALLHDHVFDPYNQEMNDTTTRKRIGLTVQRMARTLQCSQGQIRQALAKLKAFPFPHDDKNSPELAFGRLGEEVMQDALDAITSTLAEEAECWDYAGKGVCVEELVPQVVERIPQDQTYPDLEHAIFYCLKTLLKDELTDADVSLRNTLKGTIQLDVAKIAVCLAHRIFQEQTRPWEESRFCLKWQSMLPGVGILYQTNLNMLRGVAILVTSDSLSPKANRRADRANDDEAERYWKYFPADKLPWQPEELFHALFQVRDEWTLDELEPYLERLTQETHQSQVELLLQYTASQSKTVKEDGTPAKLYTMKIKTK